MSSAATAAAAAVVSGACVVAGSWLWGGGAREGGGRGVGYELKAEPLFFCFSFWSFFLQGLLRKRRARLRGAPLPRSHNALVANTSCLCSPTGGPSAHRGKKVFPRHGLLDLAQAARN
jgi:hypothetical protein